MKVLVTGGAGFIGSNLVRFMLDCDPSINVRVVDDLSSGRPENLRNLSVDFRESTILDYQSLMRAADGVDAIVHLAAIASVPQSVTDPRASHDVNATGTLNVLEAARTANVGQVIVASSSAVYGPNPEPRKSETSWTRPLSPYAVSKQATEGYAIAYQYSYGLPTLAFRFFNVYGPNQLAGHAYAAVIPKFIDAALRGLPVRVEGDGTQSRDFTYVDTICSVLFDSLTRRLACDSPVNLALGTSTTVLELVELIEQELGHPVAREFVAPRVGDVKASQADSSRLMELFPTLADVDLRSGLARTVAWYRQALERSPE